MSLTQTNRVCRSSVDDNLTELFYSAGTNYQPALLVIDRRYAGSSEHLMAKLVRE